MNLRKQFALTTIMAAMLVSFGIVAQAKVKYQGSMRSIPHTVISFSPGSAALSEEDKDALRQLVVNGRSTGEIQQITVAAWSDKSIPTKKGAKLANVDRDLAMDRANAIENYLETGLSVSDVDTYNMAESANWLARTFNTNEAELKSLFSKQGVEYPVTNAEFQIIRNEGGPSAAVVVIEKKVP